VVKQAHHRNVDGSYEELFVGPTLPHHLNSNDMYSLFCADPVLVDDCQLYQAGSGFIDLASLFGLASFNPFAASSSGVIVGFSSSVDQASGQPFPDGGTLCLDMQSGSVSDCNAQPFADQLSTPWAVLGLSEDADFLVGELLDLDSGLLRPFFLDRSSQSSGFLGFGSNAIQSQFLVQEAVEFHGIGDSGVGIRTGDGGCAIVSPDGNGGIITSNSLGSNCVGTSQIGNIVSYLESGSAIVNRTVEGSIDDSGGAGQFEAVTLAILACLSTRRSVRCSNRAARDAGLKAGFAGAIRRASNNLSDDQIVLLVNRISEWDSGLTNRQINRARISLLRELGIHLRKFRNNLARRIYRNIFR